MQKVLKGLLWGLVFFWVSGVAQPPEGAILARITRWFDGDTATISFRETPPPGVSAHETVRLLGINAPEVGEPWSEEATRHFRRLTMGKAVYVELNSQELRDAHRRLLAYLWVETEEGWVLVNENLLRAGLARLLVYDPEREKYYCRFVRALVEAQMEQLGLWSEFADPLALAQIEANPVPYVTQVVSVVFTVAQVSVDPKGWSLWAEGSRYGFRTILSPDPCARPWVHETPWSEWIGKEVLVTGVLQWDSLRGGPRIEVGFPEQIRLWTKEGT